MMSRRLFILNLMAFIVAFAVASGVSGLRDFVERVNGYANELGQEAQIETDAIVVLTGGSERVKTGIDLLRAGRGKKLLISGVFPGIELRHILVSSDLPEALLSCCVVLGHAAEDTRGNAVEAQDFMKAEGFSSLQLVTAHYHMPRSLLLFHALMPHIEVVPHPVSPNNVDLTSWWQRPGTLSLLVAEYGKYMIARLRLEMEKM